ncbi:protein DEFECTIVE IN MERISTEM SILENCING 3 [Citrus sinensis]|nr:protein DEFECTIVE IN MERISTEM SILENCING 3 [Citrus sinensis]
MFDFKGNGSLLDYKSKWLVNVLSCLTIKEAMVMFIIGSKFAVEKRVQRLELDFSRFGILHVQPPFGLAETCLTQLTTTDSAAGRERPWSPPCRLEAAVVSPLSAQTNAVLVDDSSASMQVDQTENSVVARDGMQNGGTELVIYNSKRLQDDLQMIGLKIKQHEDHIKLLKSQSLKLGDSILDLQVCPFYYKLPHNCWVKNLGILARNCFHPVNLGKYHSAKVDNEDHSNHQNEEETTGQILQHEKSAAGVLCQLKTRHCTQASHLTFTKDVLGIVASLGQLEDENLSSLLSEYLGVDTMLAIVCKTFECVKALETYDKEGHIIKSSGLHGLGASIGRAIDGRPFAGEFVVDDPQRRLDLWKPRLPTGECPPGFLGYAVNMINIDSKNLFCATASGHGLRETLFYNLFYRLQVYRTRADMLLALPLISDGAISLDGGIIRSSGVFSLGSRQDVDVRFPKSSGTSDMLAKYAATEKQIQEMKFRLETLQEDLKREQALLKNAKDTFERKKQEFVKFLADSSSFAIQCQMQAAREKFTPR